MGVALIIAIGVGGFCGGAVGWQNRDEAKTADERWGRVFMSAIGGAMIGGFIVAVGAMVSGQL
jgi:hypothetical protein